MRSCSRSSGALWVSASREREMDLQRTGKRALVTGGSRGLGRAIARVLAGEGVDVALVARDAEALERTASELATESGRLVVPVACDTGSDAAVAAMVAEAVARL